MAMDDYLKDRDARLKEQMALDRILSGGCSCPLRGYHAAPSNLSETHLAGRKHAATTIPACRDCHDTLSRRQSKWPEIWLKEGLPARARHVLMLRGISDVLLLISRHLRNLSDLMLRGISDVLLILSRYLRNLSDLMLSEEEAK